MRLPLLNVIDETLQLFRTKKEDYQQIRKELKYVFIDAINSGDMFAEISTRLKTEESMKEKLIRNRFYLDYASPQDILDNLHDIIGLKLECRFIDEEAKLYEFLKSKFNLVNEEGYNYNDKYPHIVLDFTMEQPQKQRNGFTIYRIDGHYIRDDEIINFELQIKSMVNSFWGEIEHKLIYKSTNYYVYDKFMRKMLTSLKDNLTTIDHQLHIIYDEMENSNRNQLGFANEEDFEKMLAKAINDIFTMKVKESIGFTINIKNTSDILGHYIFVKNLRDDLGTENSADSLFRVFKLMNNSQISFTDEIELEEEFKPTDSFTHIMGDYLISKMNVDFDWYVFFQMLFALEAGNNIEDFTLFIHILYDYVVDDEWLKSCFSKLSLKEARTVQEYCTSFLASTLCTIGNIKIIYNDNMNQIRSIFIEYVKELEKRVISQKDFEQYKEFYYDDLLNKINSIF